MVDKANDDRQWQDHYHCCHDARKGVVHDSACRSHLSHYRDRLEGGLRFVSEEATLTARRLREQGG